MRVTEAKKKANAKYDATHTKQVVLKLNTTTDADLLARLSEVGNKQGYIKELIRRDMTMKEMYIVRDHEAGNEIERFTTKAEAIEAMKNYVMSDKKEGIYEPEFCEVYDEPAEEIVEVSE